METNRIHSRESQSKIKEQRALFFLFNISFFYSDQNNKTYFFIVIEAAKTRGAKIGIYVEYIAIGRFFS